MNNLFINIPFQSTKGIHLYKISQFELVMG
jgi:hypothetical protein